MGVRPVAMNFHPSDSAEQRDAEPLVLASVAEQLGVSLTPRRLYLPGGTYADVDGVSPDESVLVEVYARQADQRSFVLKSGQKHKVTNDAFKLATLGRSRPAHV